MSACPECREEYPETARRHRYAEMAASDLSALYEEKEEVLKKLGNVSAL